MNIVFNVRVIIVSMLVTIGVVLPRILTYFQLDIGFINVLTEPWATFIILFVAILFFFWQWLKNIRYFLIILVIAVLVAFGLTFYFCQLPLPW